MNPQTSFEDIKDDLTAKGIWNQQSDESATCYDLFVQYLRLEPHATLEKFAEQSGRATGSLWNLSSRFHWMERAAAWRLHLAKASLSAMADQNVQDRKLISARRQILQQEAWERSQRISAFCNQALGTLLKSPEARVAAYELASLLRLAANSGEQATALNPQTEETFDMDSDPLVLQVSDQLEKVLAGKNNGAAEQPAQTPPIPEPPSAAE